MRAIDVASPASGVTRSRTATWRKTPLGLAYNAFDSERYMLTFADQAIREIAAQAPYDALVPALQQPQVRRAAGSTTCGNTAAVDSAESAYLLVHEFGHSFAGLGDEYYTSQVSYETFNPAGSEPWEPNVTALLDPQNVKWKDLVTAGTPLPTTLGPGGLRQDRARLREEAPRAAGEGSPRGADGGPSSRRSARRRRPCSAPRSTSAASAPSRGASYEAKGLYRPEADCIMFSRNPKTYCGVCAQAIERAIAMFTE